ncbi:MAG: hypothetical protein BWY11_00612 [Firmicutes bacterium ADurb.Bin182]|nr:MAG: hypothetical protein BWY11_00612 [Firmicutes bacterium ADurb.Bin182]
MAAKYDMRILQSVVNFFRRRNAIKTENEPFQYENGGESDGK